MMRRIVLSAFLVFCCFAAMPAYADPIRPPDPFVGVRGGDGSVDSTDFGFHAMTDGNCPDLAGAVCLNFDILQNVGGSIQSITFAFTSGGFGIPSSEFQLDAVRVQRI